MNCRGISLLSCIYKVYSSILNTTIVNYLKDLDSFVDGQNGFRRSRSRQDDICSLTSVIHNRLCENKHTVSAFVDMKKTFNWVDRYLLLLKLLLSNIDGEIYNAIKAIYNSTVSHIRVNDMEIDWFHCTSGVCQGDVLSTTLFSIFIND